MHSITLFHLVFSGLFGALLGMVYFALLWITVKYLTQIRWPAMWVLLSLIFRLGTIVAGLYWVSHGSWLMLIIALLGIMVIRILFTRYLRSEEADKGKHSYGN